MSSTLTKNKSSIITAFSAIIEWYDFTLFLYLAPVIDKVFFPNTSDKNSLVYTYLIFGISYLARPIGAFIFGLLGDRRGRKFSLVISMILVMLASFTMAILPSYSRIGTYATVLLLLTRLAMSISVGGEYTGITTYLLENASKSRRGLVASLAAGCSELGGAIAALAVGITSSKIFSDYLYTIGWRIPFVFGGILSLIILLLRSTITETLTSNYESKTEILSSIVTSKKTILVTFLISVIGSVTYYIGVTYIPSFITNISKMYFLIPAFVVAVASPIAGWATDKFGRRKICLINAILVVLVAIPAFKMLNLPNELAILVATILLAIPAGFASGIGAIAIPEQFPARRRLTSQAFGATLATALVGGFSPLIVEELKKATGNNMMPAYYIIAMTSIAFITLLLLMKETNPNLKSGVNS